MIFDNIFRLSPQKAEFIRFVVDRKYAFIAIEEKGIPEKDHFRLRCTSLPHVEIHLNYLTTKEQSMEFYRIKGCQRAKKAFERLLAVVSNSKLQPMASLAKTLTAWREPILNYFCTGLTNAMTEGFNRVASLVKKGVLVIAIQKIIAYVFYAVSAGL